MSSDSERIPPLGHQRGGSAQMQALVQAISALERRDAPDRLARSIDLGWAELGACSSRPEIWPGGVHEWFEPEPSPGAPAMYPSAPVAALAHAASVLLRADQRSASAESHVPIVWIGRACWPNPTLLGDALPRCIWVDPPDSGSRFWCIDVALRCSSVRAVIADGSGLDMAGSRRLQLAAESGGTIGILARPSHERRVLSAAATRWVVSPSLSPTKSPRWIVELLRCKGVRPRSGSSSDFGRFEVEWNHAQGTLAVPADVAGRSAASARSDAWPGRRAG